jgi:molybdopterin-containing oxidoreductase family iron-sulfur binding subunit
VQRINRAKIDAKVSGRGLEDGDVKTACQQSCPANAIEFGNIRDADSRVAKAKADKRNYALLDDLNTKPRTTYLSKVRNPNPELDGVRS